jgi:hypothetical protein
MYQKQKGLAMDGENLAKIYIIETKSVSLSWLARFTGEKGGEKL